MFEPFWVIAYGIGGLFLVFIIVRLISAAYFKSKAEFLRDLWQDANKGDD